MGLNPRIDICSVLYCKMGIERIAFSRTYMPINSCCTAGATVFGEFECGNPEKFHCESINKEGAPPLPLSALNVINGVNGATWREKKSFTTRSSLYFSIPASLPPRQRWCLDFFAVVAQAILSRGLFGPSASSD